MIKHFTFIKNPGLSLKHVCKLSDLFAITNLHSSARPYTIPHVNGNQDVTLGYQKHCWVGCFCKTFSGIH